MLVNNAGILRDRMLTNMTEAEWDAVIKVHLKGTFGPSHHAAAYWRDRSKAGEEVDGRIINTSSPSGIYGNVGQTNYGAAKAGIAAFTSSPPWSSSATASPSTRSRPAALTRMTENLGMGAGVGRDQGEDVAAVDRADHHVAGVDRVRRTSPVGSSTSPAWRCRCPRAGTAARPPTPVDDPEKLGPIVLDLVRQARPNADMFGNDKTDKKEG